MINNRPYWKDKGERAKAAKAHVAEMSKYPTGENRIYCAPGFESGSHTSSSQGTKPIHLMECDTVSALYSINCNGRICILNFASYKNPGGKFLEGSSAQEESLCMESNLYNILAGHMTYYNHNRHNLNRGLYLDRAIYSDDIVFIRNGIEKKADVLSCATPNRSIGLKYGSFSEDENFEALARRIRFIRMIMQENKVAHAILGAYGCGVFRQDAKTVAGLFKKEFEGSGIETTYAVPGNIHDENLKSFKEVFGMDIVQQ